MTRSTRSTEVVHPLTSENEGWTTSERSKIENTPSDLQWSSGSGEPPTGDGGRTAPQGRRGRASAARATFTAARQRGLVARHRAKLARLAQANPDAKHHCGYCTRDVPLVTAYDHTTACRRAHQEGQGS